MTLEQKPKRTLIAYCALADRLKKENAGLMEALVPFFAPVCKELAGEMFDASKLSAKIEQRYGLLIPRLAILGLAEQLERDGLLKSSQGGTQSLVYQYVEENHFQSEEVPALTELEIDQILDDFVKECRADEVLENLDDDALHNGFLDRLLHIDSMRLLSRKETKDSPRRTADTLTLKKPLQVLDGTEQRELHLDFHVAQFLLDLKHLQPEKFNRVSDIAFANMAAEAISCFSEPVADDAGTLQDFFVYLDSPLLLDILGVNSEYYDYGKELLELIKLSGATPAVFDDVIDEVESVISARIASARSGYVSSNRRWGIAEPHLLNALRNNVSAEASMRGIITKPDPTLSLNHGAGNAVGSVQVEMDNLMKGWGNQEARTHDENSIWAMLRIRNIQKLQTKIREGGAIFVARNTLLVRIANTVWRTWLVERGRHSKGTAGRWAPIALSDKQLAGYLWLRNSSSGNRTMSRARLLAHCSAAIRPRPDVKARAYDLVLRLQGKEEADTLAALMEDRDGERALIRATRADPEDVTPERLPYIFDQVKLAAGDFAAQAAREEGRLEIEKREAEFQAEVAKSNEAVSMAEQEVEAHKMQLAQVTLQLNVMKEKQAEESKTKQVADNAHFSEAFEMSRKRLKHIRFGITVLYALALYYIPLLSSSWFQSAAQISVALIGFWFIPQVLLDVPLNKYILSFMRKELRRRGVEAMLTLTEKPDFKKKSWAEDRFLAPTLTEPSSVELVK